MNPKDFKEYIAFENEGRRTESVPAATVVIVTYNAGEAILELIDSLKRQTFSEFEIVVVDNGGNEQKVNQIMAEPLLYISNKRNFGLSLGRNIGTAYARAEIVISLDDDCLAHKELVGAHVRCYRDPLILGARGTAVPKKRPLFHHFQSHYYLGPTAKPTVIVLEGNSSFRKSVLSDVGGFNPELFGAEGLELSYRIVRKYKRPEAIIYTPEAIIFHDYSKGLLDYLEKCYRHPKMRHKLMQQYPHIMNFAKEYDLCSESNHKFSSFYEKCAVKVVGLLGTAAEKLAKYECR